MSWVLVSIGLSWFVQFSFGVNRSLLMYIGLFSCMHVISLLTFKGFL